MDYNSLKKLAVLMGEEFKVIDSVTLETINLQRLITKEKEYCSNLEALIKTHDSEINTIENEATNLKCKLQEVTSKGLLLKSSLESLKSSHKMVELLKVDLKKQLQLEMIKTSEQNTNFDATVKKYEDMWCKYKLTYEKFPLVSDLRKSESKLKQKTVQLSIQEKHIKDYKAKIEAFSHIQDKREKITVLKIADKYLQREKLKLEKESLEEKVRSKEESLRIEEMDESRTLPYGYGVGESMSNIMSKEHSANSLTYAMSDLIADFNKEKISFSSPNVNTINPSKVAYRRYEAVLSKGVQLVPLLKLPPLPLLDSPPRKVRSVGNLLSPPKSEWAKESSYELAIKPLHDVDADSQNSSTPNITFRDSHLSEIEKEEGRDDEMGYVDDQELDVSSSEDAENKTLVDEPRPEIEFEMQTTEEGIDPKENKLASEIETMQVVSEETENTNERNEEVSSLPLQSDISKPEFMLESLEFSYAPRPEKVVAKTIVDSTQESKSPYFASSYLNFMEVPQKSVEKTEKESISQKCDQKGESAKDNTPVVDLTDDENQESKTKEDDKSELQNISPREKEVYPIDMDVSYDQQDSIVTQPSGMEMEDGIVLHSNKPLYSNADEKRVENDEYKTENKTKMQELSEYPMSPNEIHSFQSNVGEENQHSSYESPMDFSQVSYADSLEYPETTYASLSPDNRSMALSPPFVPSPSLDNRERTNIFGSPPGVQSFNYKFSGLPQQSSASALFGSSSSTKNDGKERKQTEVFNFAFDTKSKTPTMFKLF